MRLVRTILAFAVSASLVMFPLGASANGFAMSSDESHSSMQMDVSGGMSMDCCPDDMKGSPSQTHEFKCNMGFCCASGVVALYGAPFPSSEIPFTAGRTIPIPADQIVAFRGRSPPFRPPRV
jgi:hypothetical protein